jgi:hypothetical protein
MQPVSSPSPEPVESTNEYIIYNLIKDVSILEPMAYYKRTTNKKKNKLRGP